MVPTFLLPTMLLPTLPLRCAQLVPQLLAGLRALPTFSASPYLLDSIRPQLNITHSHFAFSLSSERIVSSAALFAMLAPGFRSRRPAPPPLEVLEPETAKVLRQLQRNPAARWATALAGTCAIAVEYGTEGHLLIHYTSPRGTLTIAGGWLGAGRRQYMWLPLRPTLAWIAPDRLTLTAAEMSLVAADLHAALDQLGERHVVEEFMEPAPIPHAERQGVLDTYARFMQSHGWQVTYDQTFSRRSLKRTAAAESPQRWSIADREALTRLEALVSEMLKGVRSSSRILFQTK